MVGGREGQCLPTVIPAQAGIQECLIGGMPVFGNTILDSRLRGNDGRRGCGNDGRRGCGKGGCGVGGNYGREALPKINILLAGISGFPLTRE